MDEGQNYSGLIKPDPSVTRELFLQWRSPRHGRTNPERMTNPVWTWLIESKLNAYMVNQEFDGPSPFEAGPCWCFDRFGQSVTELADGRIVYIAGEHEDHYDPDFYIYNDVVVRHPDGSLEIYGYPPEVFPPTDFHTATLIGERLMLIGSLGYPQARDLGFTQVYTLNLSDFSMEEVVCHGDAPGWLYRHRAEYLQVEHAILVTGGMLEAENKNVPPPENIDDWKLHLADRRWERLTQRRWFRCDIMRKDRKRNILWRIRSLAFSERYGGREEIEKDRKSIMEELGFIPDTALLKDLYAPPIPHEMLPQSEGEYNLYRVHVDDVMVRYEENGFFLRMTVEGELPEEKNKALAFDLLQKVSDLEQQPYKLILG